MIEPFTPSLKESPDTLEMEKKKNNPKKTQKTKNNPKPKGYHIIIMDVH